MWRFIKVRGATGLTPVERRIVRLVSAILLFNELDFQMVMPLGADFSSGLGIPASRIGWVTGAYAIAEFASGILGVAILNRVNRRMALAMSLLGLMLATALGGLSTNYANLIGARIMAGLFSGPAVALSYALIGDHVAEERRGRAIGMTAAVYSVVGVIGIPIGLKLAEWGGWRMPFLVIAATGALFTLLLLAHVKKSGFTAKADDPLAQIEILTHDNNKSITLIAFALNFLSLLSNFLLVPNVAAYLQLNLGYPRDQLAQLYVFGGVTTFFSMRLVGRLIDKFSTTAMILIVAPLVILNYYALYIHYSSLLPITLLFVTGAIAGSSRYIVVSTETSKVPPPEKRAGFMSLMNAAQALGQSFGAFTASSILVSAGPSQPFQNMPRLAMLAAFVSLLVPLLLIWLARLNKRHSTGFAPLPEPLI